MEILDVVPVKASVLVRNVVGEHAIMHMLVYICADSYSRVCSISNRSQSGIGLKQTNLDKGQIIPLSYSRI